MLEVSEAVRRIATDRTVAEVAFDPWRFKSEALRLEAEGIGPMVDFPQSHSRMTAASECLHSTVIERRLRHPGHPELDLHVARAVAKATGRGWRLDKADPHRPDRRRRRPSDGRRARRAPASRRRASSPSS